jgi:hypothetical protein
MLIVEEIDLIHQLKYKYLYHNKNKKKLVKKIYHNLILSLTVEMLCLLKTIGRKKVDLASIGVRVRWKVRVLRKRRS